MIWIWDHGYLPIRIVFLCISWAYNGNIHWEIVETFMGYVANWLWYFGLSMEETQDVGLMFLLYIYTYVYTYTYVCICVYIYIYAYSIYMEVSWNRGTTKSSILVGFSIMNHLICYLGVTPCMETPYIHIYIHIKYIHIYIHTYVYTQKHIHIYIYIYISMMII